MSVVLSAQTTDVNVNKATPKLFARYPDAKALALADPKDVEPYVASLGFFRMKSKSIVGLVIMTIAFAAGRPAEAHIFHRFASCQNCEDGVQDGSVPAGAVDGGPSIGPATSGYGQGGWQNCYYSAQWGMPMAVLVPPTRFWLAPP